MGKFDGYLICSDFDGTLTNSRLQISSENLKMIEYFQKNGGKFTVATGRFPEYIHRFTDYFKPNCPTISCNGGVLYDYARNEVIKSIGFEEQALDFLEYIWNEMPNIYQLGFCNYRGSVENFIKYEDCPKDETFMKATLISSFDELKVYYEKYIGTLSRFFFLQNKDHIVEHKEKLNKKFSGQYDIYPSWAEGMECLPIGVNKGNMVLELKKYLGNIKKVITVGDYANDISMFDVSDISYAVENAPDRVKAKATNIAPHHDKHAIAHVINNLI